MTDPEFIKNLRAGIDATDPRKSLESVAAAAAPDDDNDNDAAEIQRIVDARNLVLAVNADKNDGRLVRAAALLQQAIEQEKTEDTDGA